jgi:hypothetical protein
VKFSTALRIVINIYACRRTKLWGSWQHYFLIFRKKRWCIFSTCLESVFTVIWCI